MQKKNAITTLALCFLLSSVTAQSTVSSIIAASFALGEQDAVVSSLKKAAAAQPPGEGKKRILVSLAAYEERLGFLDAASARYGEAALASPVRDDGLLLDAARCALSSNDIEKADGFVRAVLLSNFDERILLRARLYAAWIQLASGDRANAFTLLRAYAKNESFSGYIPSILFTLWWADNDGEAKSRLLTAWPDTPEASIVRGEMSLAPSSYWFFMGRPEPLVSAFNQAGTAVPPVAAAASTVPTATIAAASTSTTATAVASAVDPSATVRPGSGKLWQQAGFFRNREYAGELADLLKKKGFVPVIRSETRPSGTVYYSVLISEDALGTTGTRLKDAGFESYLVTD